MRYTLTDHHSSSSPPPAQGYDATLRHHQHHTALRHDTTLRCDTTLRATSPYCDTALRHHTALPAPHYATTPHCAALVWCYLHCVRVASPRRVGTGQPVLAGGASQGGATSLLPLLIASPSTGLRRHTAHHQHHTGLGHHTALRYDTTLRHHTATPHCATLVWCYLHCVRVASPRRVGTGQPVLAG